MANAEDGLTGVERLVHTRWFVESLASPTLVLSFRTVGNPFRSPPGRSLPMTTLLIVGSFLVPCQEVVDQPADAAGGRSDACPFLAARQRTNRGPCARAATDDQRLFLP
jgi:hypothetical protein